MYIFSSMRSVSVCNSVKGYFHPVFMSFRGQKSNNIVKDHFLIWNPESVLCEIFSMYMLGR